MNPLLKFAGVPEANTEEEQSKSLEPGEQSEHMTAEYVAGQSPPDTGLMPRTSKIDHEQLFNT